MCTSGEPSPSDLALKARPRRSTRGRTRTRLCRLGQTPHGLTKQRERSPESSSELVVRLFVHRDTLYETRCCTARLKPPPELTRTPESATTSVSESWIAVSALWLSARQ